MDYSRFYHMLVIKKILNIQKIIHLILIFEIKNCKIQNKDIKK